MQPHEKQECIKIKDIFCPNCTQVKLTLMGTAHEPLEDCCIKVAVIGCPQCSYVTWCGLMENKLG